MKITILGASGDLGRECLQQSIDAGHDVTVLLRTPSKLSQSLRAKITVVEGDALSAEAVTQALPIGTEAILFAIGVDEKTSPLNLCTDVTQHVLTAMRANHIGKLVWCGGGSNLVDGDVISFGAKFVRWYAELFLQHRHFDKAAQIELLNDNKDLNWIGLRPLQMKHGPKRSVYRLGFNAFNGFSKIHFADCAHAMIQMLEDDTWLGKIPIIQY